MKLQLLNKVQEFKREILGTIAEIDGFDHIELNANNVAGEKTIMVDVFFKNGDVERMWCSKQVSDLLRNKEMTAEQLLLLPVVLAKRTDDDTTFYQIQRPTSERSEPLVVKANPKAVAFVPAKKKANWESLIALGV